LRITVDGQELDLATAEVTSFERVLHMDQGTLERAFTATLPNGAEVTVEVLRFVSLPEPQLGALRYRLTCHGSADVAITSAVDGDVVNEDSNHAFGFWEPVGQTATGSRTIVVSRTKKTDFVAAVGSDVSVAVDGVEVRPEPEPSTRPLYADTTISLSVEAGHTVQIVKYGSNMTSRDVEPADLLARSDEVLDHAMAVGFDRLLAEHIDAWSHKWETSDVVIDGDVAAQQGIRFSIFGLNSTFTGDDPDLNIGPKGFTGEKYGGVTYWDTEAFCLPFYLATSEAEVAKNLLRYRHRQLDRAIENATKLGFSNGAALFPMVTINGEECHNEWEITFEEIHRNGAIAFAVFNYIRHTDDVQYLLEGGLEVLVAISRFWSQRVSWSDQRSAWVMLGVTGPNEYENNVDNNWYTNLMARWTLGYTIEAIARARSLDEVRTGRILDSAGFDETAETTRWSDIADNLHLPEDPDRGIFLQQSNYLDKELVTVDALDPAQRPINKHWSWDRILRSPYIKQADVLQGLWVFEDRYPLDVLARNFDFYEPRTVHESSLSPSVHAVLAVRLGRLDKAKEMMLRTARLDLDDYNDDSDDGCHTTSMAGTWIAAVVGFGGMRVIDGELHVDPTLAPGWTGLRFQILFRGSRLRVSVTDDGVRIQNQSQDDVSIVLAGQRHGVGGGQTLNVAI
jgi:maltose phosphorylase